jgi:hypothetical protein
MEKQEQDRLKMKEWMKKHLDNTIARDQREYEEKQWDNLRVQQHEIFTKESQERCRKSMEIIDEIYKKKKQQ